MIFRWQKLFGAFFLFIGLFLLNQGSVSAASLSLSPSTRIATVGQNFTTDILLDTAGSRTDGVDVIVNYDNTRLTLIDSIIGELYPNKIKNDTGVLGKVTLRAASAADSYFSGSGVFATLTFRAQQVGTAGVSFQFYSGSTTDCNVAYQGTDLLTSVTNASYTISSPTVPTSQPGAPTPTSTSGSSSGGTQGVTPFPSLKPGNLNLTLGVGIVGVLLLLFGSLAAVL